MTTTGAALTALASALCFGSAAALQHREAAGAHSAHVADIRLLLRLCRRPMWLLGVGADLMSMALHVLALSIGTLAVVQPIGVTGIVFAIVVAAVLSRQRLRPVDLLAAGLVVVGLIGLFTALPQAGPTVQPVGFDLPVALGAAGLMAVCTAIGHFAPGRPRALMLAASAGIAFGITAAQVRILLLLIHGHDVAFHIVATSVTIAVFGLVGYLMLQSAYRSGHFAGSVATAAVVDAVVAVAVGGLVLHERLPSSIGDLTLITVAGIVICAGVALLVRSPAAVALDPGHLAVPQPPADVPGDRPVKAELTRQLDQA